MAGLRRRRSIKGQKTRRVNVSVDSVTDAAIQVKARRDGTSFSAAMCQLATSGMVHEEGLMDAIKLEAIAVIKASLIETGYEEGFAHALAVNNLSSAPRKGIFDGLV